MIPFNHHINPVRRLFTIPSAQIRTPASRDSVTCPGSHSRGRAGIQTCPVLQIYPPPSAEVPRLAGGRWAHSQASPLQCDRAAGAQKDRWIQPGQQDSLLEQGCRDLMRSPEVGGGGFKAEETTGTVMAVGPSGSHKLVKGDLLGIEPSP